MRILTISALPLLAASLLFASLTTASADTHAERRDRPKSAPAAAARDRAGDDADRQPLPDAVQRVIELTNQVRLKAGLPALKRQRNLQDSASWLARDMAAHRYFNHTDSTRRDMSDRIEDFKYAGFRALGENIAMGQRTPQEALDDWMRSPGHRANILSPDYAEIGVGYVQVTADGGGYWVQDFGARFDSCQVVINTDSAHTTSPRVKVSVHGDDGADRMRLSNDGVHWSAWEDFRPLRDWSLDAGPGSRTIHIEIRQNGHIERLQATVLVDEPAELAVRRQ